MAEARTNNQQAAALAIELGAAKAQIVEVDSIPFDAAFREQCAINYCGKYGRCWACPPDIGDIADNIAEAKAYKYALVFQTINPLTDSFDIEGMQEAQAKHYALTFALHAKAGELGFSEHMALGAGGCEICPRCSKLDDLPCLFPEKALPSLEGYGVNCQQLARLAKMKYINGQNTVTFFGAIFFNYAV